MPSVQSKYFFEATPAQQAILITGISAAILTIFAAAVLTWAPHSLSIPLSGRVSVWAAGGVLIAFNALFSISLLRKRIMKTDETPKDSSTTSASRPSSGYCLEIVSEPRLASEIWTAAARNDFKYDNIDVFVSDLEKKGAVVLKDRKDPGEQHEITKINWDGFNIISKTRGSAELNSAYGKSITEYAACDENVNSKTRHEIYPFKENALFMEGNRYISASRLPCGFIAAQGPLDLTLGDFLASVFAYDVGVIFDLTPCEMGKCVQYWPEKGKRWINPEGGQSIWMKTEEEVDKKAELVKREFKLKTPGSEKEVIQFQCTGWPDHNAPSSETLAILLAKYREVIAQNPSTKVLVHCSAGVGRTGGFIFHILIENLIRYANSKNKIISIYTSKFVECMRFSLEYGRELFLYDYPVYEFLINEFPKNKQIKINVDAANEAAALGGLDSDDEDDKAEQAKRLASTQEDWL